MRCKRDIVTVLAVCSAVLCFSLCKNWLKQEADVRSTYPLTLILHNAQGLRGNESVLVSGVVMGSVTTVQLDTDPRTVLVRLRLSHELILSKNSVARVDVPPFGGMSTVHITPGDSRETLGSGDQIHERVYE
ncbi:MlaD family protein [Armatimonas sp.]|uniref:MlaD family protein n=1 Tax=Armatimonas sp. TaxID=1872638 RepID=UPI0034D95A00